jgi:hypothetical protein
MTAKCYPDLSTATPGVRNFYHFATPLKTVYLVLLNLIQKPQFHFVVYFIKVL